MDDAYAKSGVDPSKITVFKALMGEVNKATSHLPIPLGVSPLSALKHPHGAAYRIGDKWQCTTLEGPGNLPCLAEFLYRVDAARKLPRKPYHVVSGVTAIMMAANDCAAQGARPFLCLDLVAANSSDWFTTQQAADLADGLLRGCQDCGMWLGAGESPAMKYIIKEDGPDIAISVTGIVKNDEELITGEKLGPGSVIVGISSHGVHGNGWTLIIKSLLEMKGGAKDPYTMTMSNGARFTDILMAPTANYVTLVGAILDAGIRPHAILPGTGDGIAKLASDKRELTYHIQHWPQVSALFDFMRVEFGISWDDMLTTFNMGIGYYFFVDPKDVWKLTKIAGHHMFNSYELGVVRKGERGVCLETENLPRRWLNSKA